MVNNSRRSIHVLLQLSIEMFTTNRDCAFQSSHTRIDLRYRHTTIAINYFEGGIVDGLVE